MLSTRNLVCKVPHKPFIRRAVVLQSSSRLAEGNDHSDHTEQDELHATVIMTGSSECSDRVVGSTEAANTSK